MTLEGTGAEWVEVARLQELRRRKRQRVLVGGVPIALFYVDGRVYALHDICIHKERNLHKGSVLGGRVICPGHQWAFDLESGWVEDQQRCQPTYATRVEGDVVYVHPRARVLSEAPADTRRGG